MASASSVPAYKLTVAPEIAVNFLSVTVPVSTRVLLEMVIVTTALEGSFAPWKEMPVKW